MQVWAPPSKEIADSPSGVCNPADGSERDGAVVTCRTCLRTVRAFDGPLGVPTVQCGVSAVSPQDDRKPSTVTNVNK
jgi:hypothetical protein